MPSLDEPMIQGLPLLSTSMAMSRAVGKDPQLINLFTIDHISLLMAIHINLHFVFTAKTRFDNSCKEENVICIKDLVCLRFFISYGVSKPKINVQPVSLLRCSLLWSHLVFLFYEKKYEICKKKFQVDHA